MEVCFRHGTSESICKLPQNLFSHFVFSQACVYIDNFINVCVYFCILCMCM